MKFAPKLAILVALFLALPFGPAKAQTSLSGVAVNVQVNDSDVVEGKIIAATGDGFRLARDSDEVSIYGVVVSAPVLSVGPRQDSTFAVLSSGEAEVLVSSKNGNIEAGDMVTVSSDAGIGQKATKSGYVLGKALVAYNGQDPGLIRVLVNPSYFAKSALSTPGDILGIVVGFLTSPSNWRYIIAAIVFLIAFIAAAVAIIKFITTGLEAIGRNPLARSTIVRGMVFSTFGAFVLAALGFLAGMAIIRIGG